MTHGERKMTMPTWPVRFDGLPSEVKSAPLLGEHTEEVLADWLGLDAPRSRACVRTASSEALAAGPPDLCRPAASAAHAGGRPTPQRGLNSADPAALNSRGPEHAPMYPSSDQSASPSVRIGRSNPVSRTDARTRSRLPAVVIYWVRHWGV